MSVGSGNYETKTSQEVREKNIHNSKLGDRATPKVLVDAINRKRLIGATALKDQIKGEFKLDS